MKKIILGALLAGALLMVCGPAMAADEGDSPPALVLRPTVSIGYLGSLDGPGYSLRAASDVTSLGGIAFRDFKYEHYSSLYLDIGLAADIGERFRAEIVSRWAVPATVTDLAQTESHPADPTVDGRQWKARTLWSALEANVSYALVKDASYLASFRPKVGVRWDYWNIKGSDPFGVFGPIAVYSPTDTMKYNSSSVMPFVGFTTTIGGLQRGMFGGDLVLDAELGWVAWGEAKHDEFRNNNFFRNDVMKGNLDAGYFYQISVTYTVLTLDFSPKAKGTVALFGNVSGYHAEGDFTGTRTNAAGAIVGGPFPYAYTADRTLFATGLTLGMTFDIFGKPRPVAPAPAPAPVIEPKLEPMSKY